MKVSLTPVLQSLRDIYEVEGVMPRFNAYLSLMTGAARGEFLPLGAFSPMGKRQADYLDALLTLNAEQIAAAAALEVTEQLAFLPDHYRMLLVVVDVSRNGWTERYLTDAEWRFQDKYNQMPKAAAPVGFDRWVTVQLWTDKQATASYIRQEAKAALYRAAHVRRFGTPKTLAAMMRQEGRALAFAGCHPDLDADDIAYTRETIKPLRPNTEPATCFGVLYGDDIARAVGYQPLGLSAYAGINVGIADAWEQGPPEKWLRAGASKATQANASHLLHE